MLNLLKQGMNLKIKLNCPTRLIQPTQKAARLISGVLPLK
jgi:hypothetical protein